MSIITTTPVEATSGLLGDKTAVTFDGEHITIRRGIIGRRETVIPLARVTAVTFKKGLTGKGYIEFDGAGAGVRVEFSVWKAGEFSALADAVRAALG